MRGYRLFGYDSIGSTSSEAMASARRGDAGDVWFAALQQTEGRGRRGRVWESPSGNLAASLLIVHEGDAASVATLGFVAGIALQEALSGNLPASALRIGVDGADGLTGQGHAARLALKWPNDVIADGGKLAGILLEAQGLPDGRMAIVIGFGVNIVAAPTGLPYPATCLHALGTPVSAEAVFAALADAWVDAFELWAGGRGVADVLARWRRHAAGLGSEVAISHDGQVVRGIFETIDEFGRLIVRDGARGTIAITAGDVHFGATATSGRT
ncbi:biotin--[acetyl-CoA-carboxylase] ligase [Devosia enhydra]|nr:biotin--[acetyl-CoA-carboxylase] ligase [Devosia enhydra]